MNVVITGAGGDIGSAIARAFIERGDNVALLYNRSEERALSLATEAARRGVMAIPQRVDLRDAAGATAALEALAASFGAPDVLVNAAGVDLYALATDTSAEAWDEVFAVNARGVFLTSTWAARHMYGGGRIVNVSSIWGSRPAPCESAYAASKAAVESFTKSFAAEVGDLGITVNAVAAGLIDTRMNDKFTAEERQAFTEALAVKREGTAWDVVHAVLFFASEEAGYVTGQVLEVSGGMR